MNNVLNAKGRQPKTNLPQVILYDNTSQDRLLEKRLGVIKNAHLEAELHAKRRKDSFLKSLEIKQEKWTRREAIVTKKFESGTSVADLNFEFGRLYHKPSHPYQAVIQAQSNLPPTTINDHSRRRPKVLPEILTRAQREGTEKEDFTFVTQHKRKESTSPVKYVSSPSKRSRSFQNGGRNNNGGRNRRTREKSRDWMLDSRYTKLTDNLSERYSPKKRVRSDPTQMFEHPRIIGLL